ncbi:hypothetical protein ILUMI_18555, partial [Ignelater luminosus]
IAVRNKWKALRGKLRITLAFLPKPRSEDEGDMLLKSHWKYFNNLLFLKDQFTTRASTGNLSKNNEPYCVESQEDGVHQLKSVASSSTTNSQIRSNRNKRQANDDIGRALLDIEAKK